MQCGRGRLAALLALGFALTAGGTLADVIVLANRTNRTLPVRFLPASGSPQMLTLAAGENLPVYLDGKAGVSVSVPGGPNGYALDANCAYFFSRDNSGSIGAHKIGLGEDGTLTEGHSLPGNASQAPLATIAVKILVDEEEPARQPIWERRLRRRVEAASAVFEKYFHTKLQVVAVGTWNSDNQTNDFIESLGEFERKVNPAPAKLAIGFTSQWKMTRGRTHMAGTRGPFHPHILAREGSPEISEPEKLEFLIHELGHYFGAAHSPERDSVMRPVLGDNRAGTANFQIHFDPVNTLAMAIISDEMRRRNLTQLSELAPETRRRLGQIYMELARTLPNDPAAFTYAQRVTSESSSPIVIVSRHVLKAIVHAAIDNRARPVAAGAVANVEARRQGDALTNHLVREAARAAIDLPEGIRHQAFLYGTAIGMSDNELLARIPASGSVLTAIEPPSERMLRLKVLGEPTMHNRRDLAQHFFLSAFATAAAGADTAQTVGLAKEFADAQTSSGFSFADIAANRAGIRFANNLLEKRITLGNLALTFSVASFMPDVAGLPEHISAKDFAAQFGSQSDLRFTKQLKEIDERIQKLPGYALTKPASIR